MLNFIQANKQEETVLSIEGELIWETEHAFTDKVVHIAAARRRTLYLDLSRVGFVDSAGIGGILRVIEHYEARDMKLRIAKINSSIEPVLSAFIDNKYFEFEYDTNVTMVLPIQAMPCLQRT